MKNIMKKFASLALVTSLFVGTLAPTSLAAVRPQGVQKTLTKTMQMKEGVSVNDTFTFDIEPTTEGPKQDGQIAAPNGLVKLEKITTDPNVYQDGGSATLNLVYDTAIMEREVEAIDGNSKTFRVKITERKGDREGMIYDESVKYMDIYVWYGQVSKYRGYFYKTFIYDKDGNKLPGLEFKNGYGKNPGNTPTPNDKVKELKVKKVLQNKDGSPSKDKEKTFKINVIIKGQVGDIFTIAGQPPHEITEENAKDGVYITVDLANDQTATIDGLTDDDKVTVNEVDDKKKNYVVTGEQSESALKDIKDQTVTITNKERTEIPTGLLNTIAPFILVIGLAGGVGVVYFKKNKSELA